MQRWRRRAFAPLMLAVALTAPILAADNLHEREARLLAQVKAEGAGNPENLLELARVRVALEQYQKALDTYGLLKKLHGAKPVETEWVSPDRNYGRLADFWTVRLRGRLNLGADVPPPDAALRRKLGLAAHETAGTDPVPGGQWMVELSLQVDLDGDLVDELFVVGGTRLPARENQPVMYLARWDGTAYTRVWRATQADFGEFWPYGYDVIDIDGDGWKEIRLGFQAEPGDDVAFLHFNGHSVLLW
jgi:hypothetical protein